MASNFFTPTDPNSGMTPNLTGFTGIPRIPGESLQQYQARLMEAQRPYQQANLDRGQIEKLSQTEEAKSRSILDEQGGIQKQRLNDLATLLAKQGDAQFNRDIPGIATDAQKAGMLETSGFGNALSRDYTNLQQTREEALAKQALADRDLQIKGIGDIGTNANAMSTSGLERVFSSTDQSKANELALKLGGMGVPAPAQQPSTTDKLIAGAGPILSGVGSVKAAGV